jgi:hypothetical protein
MRRTSISMNRSECRARIDGLVGRRRGRGVMSSCVLRHARSIGAKEFGSNFGTGWAVGWAVYPSTASKLLKELVGASGFEPPASWSRTIRPRTFYNLQGLLILAKLSSRLRVFKDFRAILRSALAIFGKASMHRVGTKWAQSLR